MRANEYNSHTIRVEDVLARLSGHVKLLEVDLSSLALGTRTLHVFAREGIKTVRDLADWTEADLEALPGFGRKSIYDLKKILTKEIDLSAEIVHDKCIDSLNNIELAPSLDFGFVYIDPGESVADEIRAIVNLALHRDGEVEIFPHRRKQMIFSIYGLSGQPKNYASIAAEFNVTSQAIKNVISEIRNFSFGMVYRIDGPSHLGRLFSRGGEFLDQISLGDNVTRESAYQFYRDIFLPKGSKVVGRGAELKHRILQCASSMELMLGAASPYSVSQALLESGVIVTEEEVRSVCLGSSRYVEIKTWPWVARQAKFRPSRFLRDAEKILFCSGRAVNVSEIIENISRHNKYVYARDVARYGFDALPTGLAADILRGSDFAKDVGAENFVHCGGKTKSEVLSEAELSIFDSLMELGGAADISDLIQAAFDRRALNKASARVLIYSSPIFIRPARSIISVFGFEKGSRRLIQKDADASASVVTRPSPAYPDDNCIYFNVTRSVLASSQPLNLPAHIDCAIKNAGISFLDDSTTGMRFYVSEIKSLSRGVNYGVLRGGCRLAWALKATLGCIIEVKFNLVAGSGFITSRLIKKKIKKPS